MTEHEIHEEPTPARPPRFRLSVAIGLAVFTSIALAAIGALNRAAIGAAGDVEHATRVINGRSPVSRDETSAAAQYREKRVAVCHTAGKRKVSLSVGEASVPAHLAQGDRLGAC